MSDPLFVGVCLDQNLQKPLDYSVPEEWRALVQVGMRVEVPLRKGVVKGTISVLKAESRFPDVRPLSKILSARSEIVDSQWKLAEWMAQYYATPLQRVLRCFIPPNVRRGVKQKTEIKVVLCKTDAETLQACEALRTKSPQQAEALDLLLQQKKGMLIAGLLAQNISRSTIAALVKKKWVQMQAVLPEGDLLLDEEFFPSKPKQLNEEQAQTLQKVVGALEKQTFSSHLIYGVTGSGKTEIYFQAIAKALELKKSAILLVPEIALTSQTIERFRARFSQKIAILHHKRSLGERNSAWEDLRSGKIQIAIGARSAIFCPIQNLGLIIIDEEHDGSYKQSDESPCYQGRDVAVMRARLENSVILLGSATPSIESRFNAEIGKYALHTLRSRPTGASLPKMRVVDMKTALEKNGGFTHFSGDLLDAMKERLQKGEQTLLLLNRRGYHRMQLCNICRTIAKCPHCDLSLTYHREVDHLKCHFCGYVKEIFRACPNCKSQGTLEFKGFGTEHVERSLHAVFPEVRTLRMDRDTTQKKHSHEELFKQFRAHKADVLIGTQMIAKGFHFPSVTLVGVLNIDASLSIPDFRAPEHAFQLLMQVAGRSGRSDLAGEVILQTFLPDHPVIQFAKQQDYDAFYKACVEERRFFGYPPFCRLAKCTFAAVDAGEAQGMAEKAHARVQGACGVQLFPVAPAGHPKIKDLYRFQFLMKAEKVGDLQRALAALEGLPVKIDVDPLSTFF